MEWSWREKKNEEGGRGTKTKKLVGGQAHCGDRPARGFRTLFVSFGLGGWENHSGRMRYRCRFKFRDDEFKFIHSVLHFFPTSSLSFHFHLSP